MYCPRECNKVAHELAKFGAALESSESAMWVEEFPRFIYNLLSSGFAATSE